MRLKLDENIDARLASLLRVSGHDAVTVREQDLHETDDLNLYHICRAENRAVVTLDLDFSNILRYPPENTSIHIILRGVRIIAVGKRSPSLYWFSFLFSGPQSARHQDMLSSVSALNSFALMG